VVVVVALNPEPVVPVVSVVEVVDLRGFFERGPDDEVVALATPGGGPAGAGSAMATPPPSDRPPTIRSAPAPARAWLVRALGEADGASERLRKSISMPLRSTSPSVSVSNKRRKGSIGTRGCKRGYFRSYPLT